MDGRVYLDTHLLVWIRDGELHKISPRMKALVEEKDLYFSSDFLKGSNLTGQRPDQKSNGG